MFGSVGFKESAVPTIQHSLSDVIAQLDLKIAELQNKKLDVPEGHPTRQQIEDRIADANAAKIKLQDSCCTTQSCNFTY
jgi:hypothetical protein